jgi:hypothetical protein
MHADCLYSVVKVRFVLLHRLGRMYSKQSSTIFDLFLDERDGVRYDL